jgi:subtilisin family serine protease
MSSDRPARRFRAVCASTALAVAAVLAFAGDLTRDLRAGDEIQATIAAGDLHTYRISLVAGASVRIDLEADGVESEEEAASPSKGGDPGPGPSVVFRDPSGAALDALEADRVSIRREVTTGGTFLLEVRAENFEGTYDLSLDVELPQRVEDPVASDGAPVPVHVDVPVDASVRIDVLRESGAPPVVTSVTDGTGQPVGFSIRQARARRMRLHPVPVTAPGGLTVWVAGRDGGSGTYRVRVEAESEHDESPEGDDDVSSRRIVVQLEPGVDPAALALQLGYELKEVRDGFAVFETPEGREGFEREDALELESTVPGVLSAEPDVLAESPEGSQSNSVVLGSLIGRQDFDGQTALQAIRADAAHTRATGRGLVVAVLDTGVDASHSLLAGHVTAGRDFVDADDDPSEERNLIDDDLDGDVDEGYGHGTFVAGLVLAAAPDAQVLAVRVLDTEARGEASDVAAGIRYAVDAGADVINLSLGGRSRPRVVAGAVRFALSRGVVVVAAAGNRGDVAVDFPAGVDGVIAVTALDAGARRPPFASASRRTVVSAPGVDLIGPVPGEQWGTWSGTSFAAALTSGGTALLLERRPTLRPTQVLRIVQRRAGRVRGRLPRIERRRLGGGLLDLRRLAR